MNPREELARRILKAIVDGVPVPMEDAIRLRNWANTPDDVLLPLAEIAQNILNQQSQC